MDLIEARKRAVGQARADQELIQIATKAAVPDNLRNTYGAGWTRQPQDGGFNKPPSCFSAEQAAHFLTASTSRCRNAPSRHRVLKAPKLPKLGHSASAPASFDERGEQRIGGVRRCVLGLKPVEQRQKALPIFGGVGWSTNQTLESKLHNMFTGTSVLNADSFNMETTALPFPGASRPRAPTPPPSIAELEMQRACFSTAKLPWLSAKKPPKDGDIEVLVKALMNAIQEGKDADVTALHRVHDFPMAYHPARETQNFGGMYARKEGTELKLRRKVLRVLEQEPICDIGELLACNPDTWAKISGMLGGLSHGVAVRNAMHLMYSPSVRQVDRAVCQAALCQRQRIVDRGHVVFM